MKLALHPPTCAMQLVLGGVGGITIWFLSHAIIAANEGVETQLPPREIVIRVLPGKRDWPSAPVCCSSVLLDKRVDPLSLRVFSDPGDYRRPVDFRLWTEGSPQRLVQLAWIKEGLGPKIYALRFDLAGSGRRYRLPDAMPKVGCGDALAFGSRNLVGSMTGGYNATFEAIDWDGDEDLDLVGSLAGDPSLATLTGLYYYENIVSPAGSILAPPRRVMRKGISPSFVDWNGDGRLDLVGSGLLFLCQSEEGDFDFELPRKLPELAPGSWEFCDWDGDGLLDLLVGQGDASKYGPAHSSYDPAREPPYTSEGVWKGGHVQGRVLLQKNIGDPMNPRYASPVPLESNGIPLHLHGSAFPRAADWDGDGDLDLICGTTFELVFFENTGHRTTPELAEGRKLLSGKPIELDEIFIRPEIADWDGDGDFDILVAGESGFVTLLENLGKGILAPGRILEGRAPLLDVGCLATISLADFNGDGHADIISGNSLGDVLIFTAVGNSGFQSGRPLRVAGKPIRVQAGLSGSIQGPIEARYGYTNPEVCDWDGDGDLDIVLSDLWGHHAWYPNTGRPRQPRLAAARNLRVDWSAHPPPKPRWIWEKPGPHDLINVWRTKPECLDYDGDGLVDLVTLDHEGYLALFLRRENPDGNLALKSGKRIFRNARGKPLHFGEGVAGRAGRGKFDLVDWDGDSDRDLLAFEFDTLKSIGYYRNEGDDRKPVFVYKGDLLEEHGVILAGHSPTPYAHDIDGDGHLDLLVGCEDGLIYYFHRAFIDGDLPRMELVSQER